MDEKEQIRRKLAAIGERRRRLEENEKELAKDTASALREARGKVSMKEAAKLVGLNRSTLYEVYITGEVTDDERGGGDT